MSKLSRDQDMLLQMALFGELDREENAGLREEFVRLLHENPEAAGLYSQLQTTSDLASSVPQAMPPERLESLVTASLPLAGRKAVGFFGQAAAIVSRCPYYFFMVGGFYLLFGLALKTVLHSPSSVSNIPGWVLAQPDIAFATGFFFILSGALLLRQTPFVARIIYGALLVYIVFVAVNGMALKASLGAALGGSLLPALAGFVGMGLTIGMLLGLMLQHYSKEVRND